MTPRALYVHIPWCVKKCPYCDFNSHESANPPFHAYGQALVEDLEADLQDFGHRPFSSIFFGGGTPSLMPPEALAPLFDALDRHQLVDPSTEITLEANPGTRDLGHLAGYRSLGVNRLSIGVQSFNAESLSKLGRVHSVDDALRCIEDAQTLGYHKLNVDLMHGLPAQTTQDVLFDLNSALAMGLSHLSWYQLTIEPNTAFYKHPPALPDENTLEDAEDAGLQSIREAGLSQYEISAFARPSHEAKHNINYWEFGDYLGIGAGAHGKLTLDGEVVRTTRTRHPNHYLSRVSAHADRHHVAAPDLATECLMNGLRLKQGMSYTLFHQRTGLDPEAIRVEQFARADALGLLEPARFQATPLGWRHLNTLLEMLV
jgi:oxygen-independent coproporphyrinogen-3 oxidase